MGPAGWRNSLVVSDPLPWGRKPHPGFLQSVSESSLNQLDHLLGGLAARRYTSLCLEAMSYSSTVSSILFHQLPTSIGISSTLLNTSTSPVPTSPSLHQPLGTSPLCHPTRHPGLSHYWVHPLSCKSFLIVLEIGSLFSNHLELVLHSRVAVAPACKRWNYALITEHCENPKIN